MCTILSARRAARPTPLDVRLPHVVCALCVAILLASIGAPRARAGDASPATAPTTQRGSDVAASSAPSSDRAERRRVALTWHEITDPTLPIVQPGMQALPREKDKPASLKAVPGALDREPMYFVAMIAGRPVTFAVDARVPPTLYADLDGDDDLSDEQEAAGKEVSRRGTAARIYEFGPLAFPVPGGRVDAAIQVKADLVARNELRVYPAGLQSGMATSRGRAFRIALLDCNLNGHYDDKCVVPIVCKDATEWDGLAVDQNGNNDFNLTAEGLWEIQPLTPMCRLGKDYYRVTAERDGSGVWLEPAHLKPGTLDLSAAKTQMDLLLFGECGFVHLRCPPYKHELPEGRYAVWQASVAHIDAERNIWTLRSNETMGTLSECEVRAGEASESGIGSSLTIPDGGGAAAGARTIAGALESGGSVVDKAGVSYSALVTSRNKLPKFHPKPKVVAKRSWG